MKFFSTFLIFCCFSTMTAQLQMDLSPSGFAPVEAAMPNAPMNNLIETAKGWAYNYNKKGADVYEITANSLKIDAVKDNAFYYVNRGQKYVFGIKYMLIVTFGEARYKVSFVVKEIYAKDQKPMQSKLSDYFTSEGKVKEDYTEMLPSLEYTAEQIVGSFLETMGRSN